MNNKTFDYLGRVFAREMNGQIYQTPRGRPVPKWVDDLVEAGMLAPTKKTFPSKLGNIVCEGFELTVAGHMAYCEECSERFPDGNYPE